MKKFFELEFDDSKQKLKVNAENVQWALNNFLWGKNCKVKEVKPPANVSTVGLT